MSFGYKKPLVPAENTFWIIFQIATLLAHVLIFLAFFIFKFEKNWFLKFKTVQLFLGLEYWLFFFFVKMIYWKMCSKPSVKTDKIDVKKKNVIILYWRRLL